MVSFHFRLGLEAKKEENLSDWFSQVCYAVNVFFSVILPRKFTITEKNCLFMIIISGILKCNHSDSNVHFCNFFFRSLPNQK